MGNLAIILFGLTWFGIAAIAFRRKLSMTIAIGGGFISACILLASAAALGPTLGQFDFDSANTTVEIRETAPAPEALSTSAPKEEAKRMYYVLGPLTPVCSDFKEIVRVEAVVKLQNLQALEAILARTGCELLPNEMILTGDTPIRSMPAGIVVAELSTGMFFFSDFRLSREQLTEAEARRRFLAANPYR